MAIGNLPFSKALPILAHCLTLIKRSGRCLFILPLDFFSSKQRAEVFGLMGAYIHRVYRIVGRVAYLRDGEEESHRQIYDAIFDIRLSAPGMQSAEEFIWKP